MLASVLENWAKAMKHILDYAVYLLVRLLVCVVQAMRIETCERVARWLATLCCDLLRFRYDVIDDNLRHAFPELSAQARRDLNWRMWEHLFLMGIEIVHAPRKIHDTNWRKFSTLVNDDHLIRAFFDDRPTVVICGHYGNFELSGYVLGILGFPSYTIARPLDNPYLDRYLNDFRGLTGQHILPKTGSAQQVESILSGGGILVLLGDQHAGPKGCWVDFFGRPASSHKAIALFSLGSDTATAYCHTRRTGKTLHLEMNAPEILDSRTIPPEMRTVPAITEWYTRHLEATIRQAPEQYWWVHRRWRDNRPKKQAPAQDKAA
jgi:Kdo2-lipid IVA lauroyltransferase/acyltransferase